MAGKSRETGGSHINLYAERVETGFTPVRRQLIADPHSFLPFATEPGRMVGPRLPAPRDLLNASSDPLIKGQEYGQRVPIQLNKGCHSTILDERVILSSSPSSIEKRSIW
jgi:hypothetical protein